MERAGIILTDTEKFLICHAPNRKLLDDHTWDFPKGHINPGEPLFECALRELKEETGLDGLQLSMPNWYADQIRNVGPIKYNRADNLTMFIIVVDELPPIESLVCSSYFTWFGSELPEFNNFMYASYSDLENLCYKSLQPLIEALRPVYTELVAAKRSADSRADNILDQD